MEFLKNSMPSVETGTTVVTGATLDEAFQKVRQQFGPEAVISGSRSRTLVKEDGQGTVKVIEVLVQNSAVSVSKPHVRARSTADPHREFRQEVERIEHMVAELCRAAAPPGPDAGPPPYLPLAEHLVAQGASAAVVDKLLTRFAAESGKPATDRPAAAAWLEEYLTVSLGGQPEVRGQHVFLGEYPGESLDSVLRVARDPSQTRGRVLLAAVLPDPERDLPRLKSAAAAAGHDAAVVRRVDQLAGLRDHLANYDQALVAVPDLVDVRMDEGGPVHQWLATQPDLQRHLLISLDRDFLDLDFASRFARSWNCDALALTRADRTNRAAKILDLVDRIPLPVSFLVPAASGAETPGRATVDHLLNRILNPGPAPEA
jgi:hypothetical protein